jgi:hypothetical protein
MLYQVEAVEAKPHYRLWVRFADGVEGEVDLSQLVGKGVFALWNDPKEFEKVYVDPESFTVAWPGGIDLAPDALYREIAGIATV